MPEEKTKGNKILEEALRESCESYPERYPPYEGEIDLGEDYARYEKRLLRRAKAPPSKYIGSASRRVSALAASFILFFACSMVAIWLSVILYDHTEMPPDSLTFSSESTGTKPKPTGSSTDRTVEGTTGTYSESMNTDTSGTHSVKPPVGTEIPDEMNTCYTVLESNSDGLQIEVAIAGYRSQKLQKNLYVDNNEHCVIVVTIKNLSAVPLYQWLPTACEYSEFPHNHEIDAALFHKSYQLNSVTSGSTCSGALQQWTIEPGKTYRWTLLLAAGEFCFDDESTKIELYGKELYSDGFCRFSGSISFSYTTDQDCLSNDRSLSVPLSVDVHYVSPEPNF